MLQVETPTEASPRTLGLLSRGWQRGPPRPAPEGKLPFSLPPVCLNLECVRRATKRPPCGEWGGRLRPTVRGQHSDPPLPTPITNQQHPLALPNRGRLPRANGYRRRTRTRPNRTGIPQTIRCAAARPAAAQLEGRRGGRRR
jgi:hypothetical protein